MPKRLGCYLGLHRWARFFDRKGWWEERCLGCGAVRAAPDASSVSRSLADVQDETLKMRLLSRVDSIVALEPDWRWRVTLKDGAVVVPIASGAHFAPDQAEAVIVLAERHEASLYLVELDALEPGAAREVLLVEPTLKAFDELNFLWWMHEIAVLPDSGEWVVLCNADGDFLLVIGPPDDVDELVGKSRDEALADFDDYARSLATHPMPRLHGAGEIDWRDISSGFAV